MKKVTTCYGDFYIEGNVATSCADDKYYHILPHADMTNDEIKDYFRILWDEEHDEEEESTQSVKVYITVSLEMKRKNGCPITEEDIDDIISNCDYSFSHEEVEIETEICGRELL